jgi:Leucine-rich repeat (LRR) protein
MNTVTLRIRHEKREQKNTIDLSNLNLDSIPSDVYQLRNLTSINLSNNNITEIGNGIISLSNLKELNLSNNKISSPPIELLNLNLVTLKLSGNPVMSSLKNFDQDWRKSLSACFGGDDYDYYNEDEEDQVPKKSEDKLNNDEGEDEDYKFDEIQITDNDAKVDISQLIAKDEEIKKLRSTISQLESEIKILKRPTSSIQRPETSSNNKRNWMDEVEKPKVESKTTSFSDNSRVGELESQLQKELLNSKRMKNEIDRLTQQVSSNKGSTGEGFLKSNFLLTYLDILEIPYDDITIGIKAGQGGFSMIYKGIWNYLPVAVKVIFDPNVTEDLLNEFNNEIKMLFLLRHPNITLLLGVSTKPQKLAIITEYVSNGSLFEFLHKNK